MRHPSLSRSARLPNTLIRLMMLAVMSSATLSTAAAEPPPRTEAVLLGVQVSAQEIELRVPSGGCTGKEHFTVEVDRDTPDTGSYTLRVYRLQPDRCKAFLPEGVTVRFSRAELGLPAAGAIRLHNRLGHPAAHPPTTR